MPFIVLWTDYRQGSVLGRTGIPISGLSAPRGDCLQDLSPTLGFYSYHRWAVDPHEFVTNAVAERLRPGEISHK